jgi:hypothetical protein
MSFKINSTSTFSGHLVILLKTVFLPILRKDKDEIK